MLLGSAHGKVTIDASGVRTGTKQAASDLTRLAAVGNQVGDALSNVGRTLTVGMTLPILALGAASIKAASDFEETKNKTMVVFEDMANSIVENANRSAKALGINKEAYMDYASSIGAALKAGGMGIQEVTALSEQAVKHFADLASFHNAQVEDVAQAWQAAIRGQYEPIQRYFPFITNEYLKTYGIANGLVDSNTKTLTANQRAIILNAIALDEKLNPALDDFAETSGGLANQMRTMDAQFKDALVMLGQNLLPIALEVVTALNGMLEKFNSMSPAMQKATIGLGAFLMTLPLGISMLGNLVSILSTLAGLAGGGGLAGLGISLGGIGTAASAAGAGISGALVPALMAIGPVILALLPAVGLLYFAFKYNFGGIRTTAEQLWWLLKYGFSRAVESIKVTLGQLGFIIQWAFQNAFQNLGAMLTNGLRQIPEIIARIRERIVAFFQQDWSVFGKLIIFGIVNGILGGIPWLAKAVLAIASTILSGLKKALGIRSPSTEGEYFGRMVARGMVQGLQEERAALAQAARDSAQAVTAQLQGAGSTFFKGGAGAPQFKAATAGNMQAAFKQFLANNGGAGKGQFSAPTSSNMQAAFKQFAATQAAVKAGPDRFTEKDRKYKTEVPIVMNFEKGITTKEAHDIYSEKLGNVLGFLEKRLAN